MGTIITILVVILLTTIAFKLRDIDISIKAMDYRSNGPYRPYDPEQPFA